MNKKYVYFFSDKKVDGSSKMSNLLGGKGANLAEMCKLGVPVPPGFTISTEVCTYYMKHKKLPPFCKKQILNALRSLEKIMKQQFGSTTNPLLVSIRSGGRRSMPGMMDTVLNVGLTSSTIKGLIKQTNNSRFSYDSYRRLIMMYADVVMNSLSKNNFSNINIRRILESKLSNYKSLHKIKNDTDLLNSDLVIIANKFQDVIKQKLRETFPNNPNEQLWGSIEAVLKSWNSKRAVEYRKIENIPNTWGTAVNVQAMVFGNMGMDSATGVAFTRNPSTGENKFFGEWLPNAQGEDVVAGIRTPYILNNVNNKSNTSLETMFPSTYKQLYNIQKNLENHFNDMLDIEFTVQKNRLWLLQTRIGKRTGKAAVKIALDFLKEKKINEKNALRRIEPHHLNELLLPIIDTKEEEKATIIAKGLPAGPGCAAGQITFSADQAEKLHKLGLSVILVRDETSPEDVHGMYAAEAILTSRGGMTSHAALVARGWGKCCIVGCNTLKIQTKQKIMSINGIRYKEKDWLTLNGSQGNIYHGQLKLIQNNVEKNVTYKNLMAICKKYNNMLIRANADSPKDALNAKKMGARGIGLCRTEHMFFNPKRIKIVRKMIIANESAERLKNVKKILPYQKKDFYEIFKSMAPLPVTVRLLDPPLHEFLPQENSQINELAAELNYTRNRLKRKIDILTELNPMLGHRGCRLGITFPEITTMQIQAIIEAALKLKKEKITCKPEIMVPLVGSVKEFINQKKIIDTTAQKLFKKHNMKIKYLIGTMIELPRACLIAGQLAKNADFLSFGTNDLTQTTFGFSRDDVGSFLPNYLDKNILPHDPFVSLDTEGVGGLIKIAIKRAKKENPQIKIGICGEHGGDPKSIQFFNKLNFNYVSCSTFRVPIAALTIAQLNC